MLKRQNKVESQVGEHGLRIPKITKRIGVSECSRVPGTGVGKWFANSESKSRISAQCFHKSEILHCWVTTLQAGSQQEAEPWRHLPHSLPGGTLEETITRIHKVWTLERKRDHVPEIKMFSHRMGKHRDQTERETRETKLIDYFSVRAHWNVGDTDTNFQLRAYRLGHCHFHPPH